MQTPLLDCTQPLSLLRRQDQPQPGAVIERRMEVAALEHGALSWRVAKARLQAFAVRSQQKRKFHLADAMVRA